MTSSPAAALAINNVRSALGIDNPDAVPKADELPEGHLRLYDYWLPSLQAGLYSVHAEQNLEAQGHSKTLVNDAPDQIFAVVAPQFSLDPKLINSYYPPNGHQAEGHILPHIVFSDPHVPWLRQAGRLDWMTEVADDRNFVPWMAVMVFKAGELDVQPDVASELKLNQVTLGTGASLKKVYDPAKLPADGAYGMTIADYLSTIKSRVNYEAGFPGTSAADFTALTESTAATKIIFPTKDFIRGVFDPTNDAQCLGLKRQRLLSHVRQLNTTGFPDASLSGHGYYSIVMSAMTGDMMTTAPTTHVVHLVSIENLDATLPTAAGTDRIGLVSLFSWTYTCIPESVNFIEMMKSLGKHMQPLRPPSEAVKALRNQALAKKDVSGKPDEAGKQSLLRLYTRLQNGYTIARWRAPSGEESLAFNRSPLVPMPVPDVPTGAAGSQWPRLSMTGRDYMVYDQSLGMMDATYASAWSLGRVLAISDSVFNAALLRFRSAIWKASTSALRMKFNQVDSWSDVLDRAVNGLKDASALASGSFSGSVLRAPKPADTRVASSVDDPTMQQELASQMQSAVLASASTNESVDKTNPNSAKVLYNGYLPSSAASSDWEIIYNWIYQVMFLGGLPAHVLFPEPSHLKSTIDTPPTPNGSKLEMEALRFFFIDQAWIDCFIDGALSCANHVEPQYDFTRLKIKQIFNQVLQQKIGSDKFGMTANTPAVPRYGFVLRSAVVKSTPDLKLTVKCWKGTKTGTTFEWTRDDSREHLVRHTRLDDTTILSLIDCLPEEIESIEMAQPAHQQRFAFASVTHMAPNTQLPQSVEAKTNIIKLFTNRSKAPPNNEDGTPMSSIDLEWKALPVDKQLTAEEQKQFYDVNTRCVNALQMCDKMTEKLVDWGGTNGCFDESDGTSAGSAKGIASASMFGIEMNDRSAHFIINNDHPSEPPTPWVRQLWTGPATSSLPGVPPKDAPKNKVMPAPVPPPGPVPSKVPRAPSLWSGTRPTTLDQSPVKGPAAPPPNQPIRFQPNPFMTIGDPEFELLVHPDYQPPPPRPDTGVRGVGQSLPAVHSVRDYLPTQTLYLYDLIFSIRRRRPQANAGRVLRTLQIEIPVSLGSRAADARDMDGNGHLPREPLLQAGDSAFGAVSIAANERFVPLLFDTVASRIRDGRWDGLPVLLITLTPKSGTTDGSMALTNDGRANAIAVRLANVQLAPIVTTQPLNIYRLNGAGGVEGPVKMPNYCGKVPIRMTEVYGNDFTDQSSWAEIIKRDIGDPSIDRA